MAIAILLVIAISVGVTLFFTRDGSGSTDPTKTSSGPTPGAIASADDTGPVTIITSDPTCDAWRPLQNALAASQSEAWRQRNPTTPASEWTPDQRAQFESAGNGMRSAADQAVGLAKQTPHRVMRELYEQFISYGRAYADSIASYVRDDDFLSQANVALSSSISAICDAIDYGGATARASTIPPADPPSQVSDTGDPSDPSRFLTEPASTCAKWVASATSFEAGLREWEQLDAKIPASQWTPEQRGVQDGAAAVISQYAADIEQFGQGSGNAVFEDFSTLASLYFRAYSNATPTYTVTDNYLVMPGLRLGNVVTDACRASVG